jgi:outer membrane protein
MVRWAKVLCLLSLLVLPAGSRAQEGPGEGLSLADAVRIVLQESPLSQIAEAAVTAAEDGRKSARGDFLPKLRTSLDYTNLNKVPVVSLPEGLAGSLFPAQFAAGETQQLNSLTTLEQPLFTGLGLLTQYRVAQLDQQGADLRQEATRQELILGTYEAYYGVLLAEKYLDVAEQAVTQLTSQAEVARQFYETGVTAKNEYLKVLVQLADTKRKRIVASYDLGYARSRLLTLLRWNANESLRLTEQLAYRPYERALDECIRLAVQSHPDILLAELDIEKANKGIVGARSRYFPQISLVGGLQHEEGGFAEADEIFSATLHAEWLVWEWGSNYYKVRQEHSRLQQARARKTQTQDLTELAVREAYIALEGAREAIGVARVGVEQAEENYRITDEQFKESIATSQEVLDAQTGLSQAQVNYYQALKSYTIAIARLEKAMGVLQEPKPGETDAQAVSE